jgi:hypothetical protein
MTLDTNGNVISTILYKPWGEMRFADGTSSTDYKFTGQLRVDIGIYSMGRDFTIVIFRASEAVEFVGFVKYLVDLGRGDPSGKLIFGLGLAIPNVIADFGRMSPSIGYLGNIVSLRINIVPAINIDAITIYH